MREMILDASAWQSRDDFYDALLPSLGAPAWHKRTLDALNDSIGGDDLNAVRLPFRITIAHSANGPSDLREYIQVCGPDRRSQNHAGLQRQLGPRLT